MRILHTDKTDPLTYSLASMNTYLCYLWNL